MSKETRNQMAIALNEAFAKADILPGAYVGEAGGTRVDVTTGTKLELVTPMGTDPYPVKEERTKLDVVATTTSKITPKQKYLYKLQIDGVLMGEAKEWEPITYDGQAITTVMPKSRIMLVGVSGPGPFSKPGWAPPKPRAARMESLEVAGKALAEKLYFGQPKETKFAVGD